MSSFDILEDSEAAGSPVSLLRITSDAISAPVLYTDVTYPVTFNGETYMPLPLKVANINISETLDKASLSIEMPASAQVPMWFRFYPMGGVVNLTIFYGHEGSSDFLAIWAGRVAQVNYTEDGGTASLECEPVNTSLMKPGLRRNYQRLCPHVLFGEKCKADKAAHTVMLTVQSVSGDTVRVDKVAPAANYKGGMIEWTRNLEGQIPMRDLRMVTNAVDGGVNNYTELTIMGATYGLAVGATIKLTRGCTHELSTCRSVFNNAPNYGGMPWIPSTNPSGGASIY